MKKITSKNYIAIKVDHMNGQQVIRCTANKDMELSSEDGSKKIGIAEGEVFYLVASESLGENMYYVVIEVTERGYEGWRCQCMATKPCKHEKAVNTSLRMRFLIAEKRRLQAERRKPVAAKVQEAQDMFRDLAKGEAKKMDDAECNAYFLSLGKAEDERRASQKPSEKGTLSSNRGFSLMAV